MAVNPNCEHWPLIRPQLRAADRFLTQKLNDLPIVAALVLSPMESRIFHYVTKGKSTQQISQMPDTTDNAHTIKVHQSHMYKKNKAVPNNTMAALVNLSGHSDVLKTHPYPSPLNESIGAKGALFLKCVAFGLEDEADIQEHVGDHIPRSDKESIMIALGAETLPYMVVRAYELGLFIPKSQLSVQGHGEAGPGSV